ncbi:hypothetical protein KEM56_002626 [Ascosphaera pollenicola]|nr:hypothetical protein KEM56_002626 [Ascosphaera pollenicola]
MRGLPTDENREIAAAKIRAVEQEGMEKQVAQPGLSKLLAFLQLRGVKKALCTRNNETPVLHLIANHMKGHYFDPIVTRDTPDVLPKPDPAGIHHITEKWGLKDSSNLLMIGDSIDDMTAGRRAGATTILLLNEHNGRCKAHPDTDVSISRLDDLIEILDNGFEVMKHKHEGIETLN